MGIKQLMNLINEKAPGAVARVPLESYQGKVIACDASMAIYQFMIATQFQPQRGFHILTDDGGSTTAHLLGLFYRTIQFLETGIKPVWVFDGKPPSMKATEIERRRRLKVEARDIFITGAPAHREPPPLQYTPDGQQIAAPEHKPSPAAAKQTTYRKRYVGQVRDLEMEFSAKHAELTGKQVEPCLSCPDYCYLGESDGEEVGDAREMISHFEGLKRQGQSPEELEDARKQAQKTVRVTKEMTEDAKLLLTLLGVPVIVAPSEAEAQCAALVKAGKADAVASEDMDSLAFGSSFLLRSTCRPSCTPSLCLSPSSSTCASYWGVTTATPSLAWGRSRGTN